MSTSHDTMSFRISSGFWNSVRDDFWNPLRNDFPNPLGNDFPDFGIH